MERTHVICNNIINIINFHTILNNIKMILMDGRHYKYANIKFPNKAIGISDLSSSPLVAANALVCRMTVEVNNM